MRLGMLSTSLSHCCWVTLWRSWRESSSSSALFDGLWPSIFLLITFQRFSMGFMSGDWAGHDRVLIWWSFIHTFTDLAVWHGALFCWKKHSSELGNIVRAEGSKFSTRTTLYLAWFMRLSQRQICPIPALLKHPQIITDPPPNFTVVARHCGL